MARSTDQAGAAPNGGGDPTATPRRSGAEATRAAILSAARELFSTNGFGGTSVADIATAAGLAPGTIYIHFENKADLLAKVIQETRSPSLPTTAEELAGASRPEMFALLAQLTSRETGRRAEYLMALAADATRTPGVRRDFYANTFLTVYESMEKLLASLPECADTDPEDLRVLAHVILNGAVFTAIEQGYLGGDELHPVDADRLTTILGSLAAMAVEHLGELTATGQDSPAGTRKP